MFSFLRRKSWRELDHWALDLETTGLDPRRDQILSAGLVPIRGGVILWGERIYHRVKTEGDGGSEAVAIHGLLPDEASDGISVGELVHELEERLTESVLVVHWSGLDVELLKRAFRRHGVRWPRPKIFDTARLLAKLDRRRGLIEPFAEATSTQLAEARQTLGLPPHREHHALYDALATAELYLLLRSRLD